MKPLFAKAFTILLLLFTTSATLAQDEAQNPDSSRLSPKEFTIPASPLFDLMGVTPSQVNRSLAIKNFKVDWLFKSWKLNPNFTIQSQPIWEILYNRKDLSSY